MRTTWTERIIKLSSKVAAKKQTLRTEVGLSAISVIFQIIGWQLILFVFSLPLYFVTDKIGSKEDTHRYRMQRAMTFSSLMVILLIWVFKLMVIFYFQSYVKTDLVFETPPVNETISINLENYLFVTESAQVKVPELISSEISEEEITIIGTAKPETEVYLDVIGAESEFYASATTDASGVWRVEIEDQHVFSKNTFNIFAVAYDRELNLKSQPSDVRMLNINLTTWEQFLFNLDAILNSMLIFFIILGFMFTLLIA